MHGHRQADFTKYRKEENSMKKCPKCLGEMETKSIGPVEVDECRQCKGVWFDKDELRQAKDFMDSDLHWMDFEVWKHADQFKGGASPLVCVACEKPMVSVNYGETAVLIDYCPSCRGIWLEDQEFKKIIDSLEKELLTKTFAQYVKESIHEAKEIFAGPESFASEWKDFATVLRMMEYRLFVEHPALLNTMTRFQRII
jgi:uncharacterized protein